MRRGVSAARAGALALLLALGLGACQGPEGGPLRPGSGAGVVLEGFEQPRALAVDAHGLLYVADGRGRVACVMADGQRVWLDAAQAQDSGLAPTVSAVVVDGRGRVAVADPASGQVLRLEPGGVRRVLASGLAGPVALACDRDGGLYVACQGDGTVRHIPAP